VKGVGTTVKYNQETKATSSKNEVIDPCKVKKGKSDQANTRPVGNAKSIMHQRSLFRVFLIGKRQFPKRAAPQNHASARANSEIGNVSIKGVKE